MFQNEDSYLRESYSWQLRYRMLPIRKYYFDFLFIIRQVDENFIIIITTKY